MPKRRPQYIEDRIAYREQRKRHAAEASPDCKCVFCMTEAEIDRLLAERIRLSVLLHGEPPF